MMLPSLTHYPTLTQALEFCTSVNNPDQIATKVTRNLTSRFPDSTHVVLFVTTAPASTQSGTEL